MYTICMFVYVRIHPDQLGVVECMCFVSCVIFLAWGVWTAGTVSIVNIGVHIAMKTSPFPKEFG